MKFMSWRLKCDFDIIHYVQRSYDQLQVPTKAHNVTINREQVLKTATRFGVVTQFSKCQIYWMCPYPYSCNVATFGVNIKQREVSDTSIGHKIKKGRQFRDSRTKFQTITGKGKVLPSTGHEGREVFGARRGGRSTPRPCHFTPGK